MINQIPDVFLLKTSEIRFLQTLNYNNELI